MEIIVSCLMLVVGLSFILKLTLARPLVAALTLLGVVLFAAFSWGWAIEQSKTQISAWLADTPLMLDLSVVLTFDVAALLLFCQLSVLEQERSWRAQWVTRVLSLYPGFLIFPTVFSLLVSVIFVLPGIDFSLIAWSLAGAIAVGVPIVGWGLKWLLPERELRLEMLFLLNVLIAFLGIIATVNGSTAVEAESSVDWSALAAVATLTLILALVGYLRWRWLVHRNKIKP